MDTSLQVIGSIVMRASRCLAKSLSARAELPILSCNGMHVIVF
jgi:hypothetical protein